MCKVNFDWLGLASCRYTEGCNMRSILLSDSLHQSVKVGGIIELHYR